MTVVCVSLHHRRHVGEEEDELSEVEPDAVPQEVREWLASTFTRQLNTSRRKTDEKPRFRSVTRQAFENTPGRFIPLLPYVVLILWVLRTVFIVFWVTYSALQVPAVQI